jgi:hypothetical protein
MIKRLDATFDPKDHGHANFAEMVKAIGVDRRDQEGRDGPSAPRALNAPRTDRLPDLQGPEDVRPGKGTGARAVVAFMM